MPAPLLNVALGLAQYAPDILKLFGKEDEAKVASKVVETAIKVTGSDNEAEAKKAISNNPEYQFKFQQALLEDKWVQERIDLANVQSARDMYAKNSAGADRIADNVTKYNLPLALILFSLNILAMYFLKTHSEILIALGNLTGFMLNSLLKERQDIINFHFGSSLGSKIKDLGRKPSV